MAVKFDLNGWECFSDRRNSKSYVNYNKTWMVKFDTEETKRSEEELKKEMDTTLKVVEIGVKTPHVKDIVELEDGTLGLIYEYIQGKKSIARACGEDVENLDNYMMRFARSAKDFHSHLCDKNKFESCEEKIRKQISTNGLLNEARQKKLLKLIDETENTTNCLHGDFHTGNFIMTKDKEFAIDLGAVCYGNPLYDVGIFYYFTHYMPGFITERIFHCEEKYNIKMWESFAKYYYGTDDKGVKDMDAKMKKYAFAGLMELLSFSKAGPEISEAIEAHFDEVFKD